MAKKQKLFFYTDKSGRGFKETVSLEQVEEFQNLPDWDDDEKMLHSWAQEAEEGDEWENHQTKLICTKTNEY